MSGFLGSGKTTLVRHLLADARRTGSRVAVVSNEFGELGIDAALLSDVSDDYVELSGGCVCCKLSDALVETLEVLRRRAHPDRIVIETSGVALPFETQLQLWRDPVRQWISDDVAVVVVNAEQLAAGRDLDDTFTQQVSSADFLLLNQTDRVPAAALPSLERELRKWEPEAPLLPTVHAQVSPEVLFPPDLAQVRARRRAAGGVGAPPHDHARDHAGFRAEELVLPAGLACAEIRAQLRGLGALRAKGFVATREGLRVVQGVGARIELASAEGAPPELIGRVVVIRR
ncbi:MAG TPA: GTP-binding protein [Myxococcota bacterium]|nr:GTP-binding protein [Myxococcota bacterium]